jgi:hypothetical protein
MGILFSGDFHAGLCGEINYITKTALIKKYGEKIYSGIKYHIILGDGGFLWEGNFTNDCFNFRTLDKRRFPVLCVIGNHEPMLGMDNLEETDIGIGEKVIVINREKPLVAYLKRGKIYNIDGIKMLVLGGALSIDKSSRKPDISWWSEEYWSQDEKENLLKLLKKDNSFDIVISHTGPQWVNKKLFGDRWLEDAKFKDEVAELNDIIEGKIKFKEWFFGHFHEERHFYDNGKKRGFRCMYNDNEVIEKNKYGITAYSEHFKRNLGNDVERKTVGGFSDFKEYK